MSDDGSSDPYVPDYEEPTMEIVVETLTGTTFEMTVSPDDTIMSIKSKIQRVEGIPVSQQHLLHRLKELNNEDRLCDHGVTAGSTLRLVLSMRGGPISTRRLASSEHHLAWRELKEYVDNTREDMIDKLPPGSKVTVLLFRDGENINLIRVIEHEDGTCYPYSDGWPPSRTVPKETSQAKYRERSNENNTMMHKVIELRRKMEGLSMQKKAKKPGASKSSDASHDYEEPSCSRVNPEPEEVAEADETAKLFGTPTDPLRMGKSVSELYSDRFLLFKERRNTQRNLGRSHRPHRLDSSLSKADDIPMASRNCTSIQAPSIAILEEEPDTTLNKKESEFSSPSPISVASGDANTVTMSQIPSLPGSSRNLLHVAHVLHDPERPKTSPDKYDPQAQDFCNVLFNDAAERSHNSAVNVKLSVTNRRQSLDFNKTNLPRMQFASSSNSKIDTLEPNLIHNKRDSNLLTSQYASTSKLNSVHLDNMLGNRVSESSNTKFNNDRTERRSPLYGRRARIERIRNDIGENSKPEKYGYSNLGYIANIEKIQNDSVSRNKHSGSSSSFGRFVSNLESRTSCYPASYELRPQKLPRRRCTPVQETVAPSSSQQSLPAIVPKKPARTRCAFCNKRLNITTIHTCRCGGIFCSQHRYSEVHGCHYDYKTEGRKFLEQANPLVAAPKLPKI